MKGFYVSFGVNVYFFKTKSDAVSYINSAEEPGLYEIHPVEKIGDTLYVQEVSDSFVIC